MNVRDLCLVGFLGALATLQVCATGPVAAHEVTRPESEEEWRKALPLLAVDTISWVDVLVRSDVLTDEDAKNFERLVRLRLRNDLSHMRHVSEPVDEFSERLYSDDLSWDEIGQINRRRSTIELEVTTVGTEYPIAYHVELRFRPWGSYEAKAALGGEVPIDFGDVLSHRLHEPETLGVSNERTLQDNLSSAIRRCVQNFAVGYFEQRDWEEQTMQMELERSKWRSQAEP